MSAISPDDYGCCFVEIGIGTYRSKPPKLVTLEELKRMTFDKDVEAYSSVYRFQTYDPYTGPILSSLLLDFDCKDLELARKEALKIINYFIEKVGVPEEAIWTCFSGSKGFHVFINRRVFGTKPHEKLNIIWRFIAEKLRDTLKLSTLDMSTFDRRRMVRLENTVNKRSNLFKIPLTLEELHTLSIDEIKELARKPRTVEREPSSKITVIQNAFDMFNLAMDELETLEKRWAELEPIRKLSTTSELPEWIKARLEKPVEEGRRNNTIFQLTVAMVQYGISIEEAYHILLDFNRRCKPPLDTTEVKRTIESAYKGVSEGKYSISPYSDAFVEFAGSWEQREFLIGDEPPLDAAGGIKPFIYEPIGDGWYVWIKDGKKGVSRVNYDQERKGFFLSLDGDEFRFKEVLLGTLPWATPPRQEVMDFIKERKRVMSGSELFSLIKKYFTVFIDLTNEWQATISALGVFESQLRDVLRTSLFYITFASSFGAGKTTALEAETELFYHGLAGSSVSDASQGRVGEFYRASWGFDEYDEFAGETSKALSRVGYRPGGHYIRWNPDKNQPDITDPYAVRAFTIHSEHEAALKTRSLTYIELLKSSDHRVPIINKYRRDIANQLTRELWFWRLDFLSKYEAGDSGDSGDASKSVFGELASLSKEEFREGLYRKHTKGFLPSEVRLLEALRGRDAELVHTAISVARLIDTPEIIDDLVAAINQKRLEEAGEHDARFLKLVDIVKQHVNNPKTELGKTEIRLPDITNELIEWCKQNDQKVPAPSTLSSWYRRLDIVKGVNVRHCKDGNYLLLDERVKNAIKSLEEFEELKVDDLKKSDLIHRPSSPKKTEDKSLASPESPLKETKEKKIELCSKCGASLNAFHFERKDGSILCYNCFNEWKRSKDAGKK